MTQLGEQPDGTFAIQAPERAKVDKRRISISQLNCLSQCGELYRRRYIMKQRSAASISMIVGSAVDKSVTLNMDRKIMTGALMTPKEASDIAVAEYRRSIFESRNSDEGIMFKKAELEDGKDASIKEGEAKAIRLSQLHAVEVAPKLQPLYVQRSLSITLPGYDFDLGGVIDLQEIDGTVRDTKTKDKSPTENEAYQSDQLTNYAMLVMLHDGTIPPKLILDCLVDTKVPKYVMRESTREEEDFNPLIARIEAASTALEYGVFIPARETDWWCGEYACSFWKVCKYVKRSKRLAA